MSKQHYQYNTRQSYRAAITPKHLLTNNTQTRTYELNIENYFLQQNTLYILLSNLIHIWWSIISG